MPKRSRKEELPDDSDTAAFIEETIGPEERKEVFLLRRNPKQNRGFFDVFSAQTNEVAGKTDDPNTYLSGGISPRGKATATAILEKIQNVPTGKVPKGEGEPTLYDYGGFKFAGRFDRPTAGNQPQFRVFISDAKGQSIDELKTKSLAELATKLSKESAPYYLSGLKGIEPPKLDTKSKCAAYRSGVYSRLVARFSDITGKNRPAVIGAQLANVKSTEQAANLFYNKKYWTGGLVSQNNSETRPNEFAAGNKLLEDLGSKEGTARRRTADATPDVLSAVRKMNAFKETISGLNILE